MTGERSAKSGYAPVNGLELYYEVLGQGGHLPEARPEEVTAAISNLLSARSQP